MFNGYIRTKYHVWTELEQYQVYQIINLKLAHGGEQVKACSNILVAQNKKKTERYHNVIKMIS